MWRPIESQDAVIELCQVNKGGHYEISCNDEVPRCLVATFKYKRDAPRDELSVIFSIEYGVTKISTGRAKCVNRD